MTLLTTHEIPALIDQLLQYRASKGFSATTWEDYPTRVACLFAEIEELSSALHGGGMVEHELADVAMYTLCMLHDLWPDVPINARAFHGNTVWHASPERLTAPLRTLAKSTFEAWRRDRKKDARISLEILLSAVDDLGQRLRIPGSLSDAIRSKIAHASGRPPLHGGKNPRS